MRSTAKPEAGPGARRLSVRERRAVTLAFVLAIAVALFALLRDGATRPRAAPGQDWAGQVAVQPPPAAVAEPPPAPPLQARPSLAGFVLHGVSGEPGKRAALIGLPAAGQRLVRVGRQLAPGLTLKEVGVDYAVIGAANGDARLELRRFGPETAAADPPTATAAGVQALQRGRAPAALSAADHQERSLQFRLGLAPVKAGGRIAGFALRPRARLPVLEAAGLRPGDVLLAVNGQAFESEERVLELSREIAGSYTAEFEFLRAGRRMKASVDVNDRPAP